MEVVGRYPCGTIDLCRSFMNSWPMAALVSAGGELIFLFFGTAMAVLSSLLEGRLLSLSSCKLKSSSDFFDIFSILLSSLYEELSVSIKCSKYHIIMWCWCSQAIMFVLNLPSRMDFLRNVNCLFSFETSVGKDSFVRLSARWTLKSATSVCEWGRDAPRPLSEEAEEIASLTLVTLTTSNQSPKMASTFPVVSTTPIDYYTLTAMSACILENICGLLHPDHHEHLYIRDICGLLHSDHHERLYIRDICGLLHPDHHEHLYIRDICGLLHSDHHERLYIREHLWITTP